MRVVVPFVALHPLALRGLQAHAPDADLVDLGAHPEAYWRFLCTIWGEEDFLIVEQDIELHDDVLPQLEACDGDWCIFGYPGPDHVRGWAQDDDGLLIRSLGCTRFSLALQKAYPELMTGLHGRLWSSLDSVIYPGLEGRGVKPCLHSPPVLQHHVWDGVCCCRTGHDPFPVDNFGRYVPSNA